MRNYVLLALITVTLTACAPTRPPSGIERALYAVETNYVASVIPQVLSNGTVVAITNQVPVYRLVPSAGTEAALHGIGFGVGGMFGLGGVLSAVLAGLYSFYASARNSKVTAALVQGTETVLEVIKAAPEGSALRERAVTWLEQQQKAAGVVEEIAKAVRNIDTRSARDAAQEVRGGV